MSKVPIQLFLVVLYCLQVFNASGQSPLLKWANVTGNLSYSAAYSVTVDHNESSFVVGSFYNTIDLNPGSGVQMDTARGGDSYIQKFDSIGSLVWAKTLRASNYIFSHSCACDSKGNIYVTGYFKDSVDFDPGTAQHNIYASQTKCFVLKLDKNGSLDWVYTIDNAFSATDVFAIRSDKKGHVFVAGMFSGTADFNPGTGVFNMSAAVANTSPFIQKIDTAGNFIWAKSIKNTGRTSLVPYSLSIDGSGNVYTTGVFNGSIDFDPGSSTSFVSSKGKNRDSYIHKLDSNGNFKWVKALHSGVNNQALSNTTDKWGNVYVTGDFDDSTDFDPGTKSNYIVQTGKGDHFVLKLDSVGNFLWVKTIGGKKRDQGRCITTDTSGNVYSSGFYSDSVDFNTGAGSYFLPAQSNNFRWTYIQKMDSAGNFIWARSISSSPNSVNIPYFMACDKSNNLYVAGEWYGKTDFDPNPSSFIKQSLGSSYNSYALKLSQISCVPSYSNDSVIACDSIVWIDGLTYSSNNSTSKMVFKNSVGCDSIVTLALTINKSTTGIDSIVACDRYTWNGITYNTSNYTAKDTLQNAAKCDSIVTLALTINKRSTTIDSIVACNSYTWHGITYYTSNYTAKDTLQNATQCDSIVTLALTINKSSTGIDSIVACDRYTWNGITYVSSNFTAKDTLVNAFQCDSIVTLALTIKKSTTGVDSIDACNSYMWNGITYTSSNYTAKDTLQNAVMCDSIVTLALTINNSSVAIDSISACNSYKWIDGKVYTASNRIANHTLVNSAGCDSIVTLNLTINSVSDVSTTLNGVSLTANNSNGVYQWLDCDKNSSPINGENKITFTATLNGNYAVEIMENGCLDTSDCTAITTVGDKEYNLMKGFIVAPNPTNGIFTIKFNETQASIMYRLLDISWKVLETKNFENVSLIESELNYAPGMYLIEISDGLQNKIFFKIQKL